MWIPVGAQIFPGWIRGLDQGYLLGTKPPFQLFFPLDCSAHIVHFFEPDEAVAVVPRGEPLSEFELMFEDAVTQVAGHSDVQSPTFTRDYVCEIGVFGHCSKGSATPKYAEVSGITRLDKKQILRLPPPR
jgi:hypothetical protein